MENEDGNKQAHSHLGAVSPERPLPSSHSCSYHEHHTRGWEGSRGCGRPSGSPEPNCPLLTKCPHQGLLGAAGWPHPVTACLQLS